MCYFWQRDPLVKRKLLRSYCLHEPTFSLRDRIPTYNGQTDGHYVAAYIALAWRRRRAVKKLLAKRVMTVSKYSALDAALPTILAQRTRQRIT